MTEKELFTILKQTNLPVAYDHFEQTNTKTVEPPFILYRNDDSFTQKAEDKTWWKCNNYIVELCTNTKNVDLEDSLEDLFTENEIPFDKEELFIDEERMYEIRYYIC